MDLVPSLLPDANPARLKFYTGKFIDDVLDYCNRQNPNPYRERKAAFLRRRDSEPFRSALSVKTVRSFSFRKQVCMWLLKLRLFGILNLLLRTGRF